ncbi:hypothetical protein L3Q82_021806 [Scortum barcoo]|uniref:Uncharacterized protein n=1 Tax=Scortum barcoo TaxID=214431 RepID=A0ACB8X4S2_9TELE|nr:hypothetical protein L3Q82_021806 [Scortum barcoo]
MRSALSTSSPLDVVGLSWLTRLCNIAWRSGTVPLVWQTGVVVPLFKRGTGECVPTTGGSHFSAFPGKVYARVLERRIWPIVEPSDSGGTMRFSSQVVEHWTSSIPSTWCLRVNGSLPKQSTCSLWIWRRHSTNGVHRGILWGVLCEYGVLPKGCSVSVRPEQEPGSHCRQRRQGLEFGNHRISSLLFADDVVLLASSSQDLQHVLEAGLQPKCEAAGMRISTSKSEAMVLDRKRVACPLRVGGEVLPQVEEFKYLGVLFTGEGKDGA